MDVTFSASGPDFAAFAGRPLVPFFDVTKLWGMEDWRHRILQGLRGSRLLLACLSPSYFYLRGSPTFLRFPAFPDVIK